MILSGSIEIALRASIEEGTPGGAATLVWRGGRVVQTTSVSRRDVETGLPVERDTIFRIASMTKPVTSVAALMLLDEGRFSLDEPITSCAPEFSELRVLRDPDGPLDQTGVATRPITFGDLLTHRSGLTYGEFHLGPIARASAEALGGQIDNTLSADEWIARLASKRLPSGRFSSVGSFSRWACATRDSSLPQRSESAVPGFAGSTTRGDCCAGHDAGWSRAC